MRTFLIILLLTLCFRVTLSAQTETTTVAQETAVTTTDSITKSGKKYALHTGSRGGLYIIRTSAKGKTYKQYLKKEELAKLLAKN